MPGTLLREPWLCKHASHAPLVATRWGRSRLEQHRTNTGGHAAPRQLNLSLVPTDGEVDAGRRKDEHGSNVGFAGRGEFRPGPPQASAGLFPGAGFDALVAWDAIQGRGASIVRHLNAGRLIHEVI